MKIWAHSLVYNEENYLWFSIISIIDFVDKVLLWDTGSTDQTVKVIEELVKKYPNKISFKQVGQVSKEKYPEVRQKMLDETTSEWIFIVDGDEVWPQSSLEMLKNEVLKNSHTQAFVTPFVNAVGDLYHYLDPALGKYQIYGKKGFLTIRLMSSKIKGLHVKNPYGKEGYFDDQEKPIQESVNLKYIDVPFLHLTHLKRSSKGQKINKYKYSKGLRKYPNFKLPDVFHKERPDFIKSPLGKRGKFYEFISLFSLPKEYILKKL